MEPHTTPPALHAVRPPTPEELAHLWHWLKTERDAESALLMEESTWHESFWIAVFDSYCTGGPGYVGRVLYLVWDGYPDAYDVFTWQRGFLAHVGSHGDACRQAQTG